jgi:hypothetical protein
VETTAYQARPGRPAVVADSLTDLRGPTSGVIEPPLRLFWQPDRHVDLDNPAVRGWWYETVLREAVKPDDLRDWLDGATLTTLWPDLYLPRGVRAAWERRHPGLRGRSAAA